MVIHQATALAGPASLRTFDDYFTQTDRLRTDGTDHRLAAARIAGARRFIAQRLHRVAELPHRECGQD